MIGFCSSPRFIEHYTGPYHPERPDRIKAIYAALHMAGFLEGPSPFPDLAVDFGNIQRAKQKLVPLSFGSAEAKWVATVHTPRHIQWVQRVCEMGGGVLDQGDTPVGPDSYEIAMLAVGAALGSCDAIMKGQVDRAFAALRPPGHHAEPDHPMGFCIFNNAAIAARYLQMAYDLNRVAIVDFDVHHGNGTQVIFDYDPSVYFASLHQHPATCYPGTGYDTEVGLGPGKGYTLNVAFSPGTDDRAYLQALNNKVVPALEEYKPEFLILCAGFDAHVDDPLAQLELSDECYELITRSLVGVAQRQCKGRVLSLLEGGYELDALGRCVVRHLLGMM